MTPAYIWSQVLTVIEYGLLGWSYQAKNRKLVVVLDIFSMLAGIVVFLLLGADLGMGMSVVILLANFYYLYQERAYGEERKLYPRDFVALGLVLFVIAIIAVNTFDGWLSLLSVAATVIYEVSIWQKSTKVYKFLGIPVAFCWMTYNGFVGSIFGVICEAAMFVSSIIGYVREVKSGKRDFSKKSGKITAEAGGEGRRKAVRTNERVGKVKKARTGNIATGKAKMRKRVKV